MHVLRAVVWICFGTSAIFIECMETAVWINLSMTLNCRAIWEGNLIIYSCEIRHHVKKLTILNFNIPNAMTKAMCYLDRKHSMVYKQHEFRKELTKFSNHFHLQSQKDGLLLVTVFLLQVTNPSCSWKLIDSRAKEH